MLNHLSEKIKKVRLEGIDSGDFKHAGETVARGVRSEIKSVLKDPVSRTSIGIALGICVFAGYKDDQDKTAYSKLISEPNYTELVSEGKDKTLYGVVQKIIFDASVLSFEGMIMNGEKVTAEESREYSINLLKEIENRGLLGAVLPGAKTKTFLAFLNLIYVYIYTITIRRAKERNMPVASASFTGFSLVNFWFAIKNGIIMLGALNFNSIGYLGACIMGAITVVVNERVKYLIKTNKVKQGVPEGFEKEFEMQISEAQKEVEMIYEREIKSKNILFDFAIGEKSPVVIYKGDADGDPADFLNEKPLFWNPALYQLTGWDFDEVKDKTQYEIMEMLYGYSDEVFENVIRQLTGVYRTGFGYRNKVFPLMTKEGEIRQVAWHTEKLSGGGRISFGNVDQAEIQNTLRKDDDFDCLNAKAMADDFLSIIRSFCDNEEIADQNKVMSIITANLDDFNQINTRFGRIFGDMVLNEFISFINKELRRKDDNIYRKKGTDEFVLICNFVNKTNIFQRIEKMKDRFSRITVIADFKDGDFILRRIEHKSRGAAQAYHESFEHENSLNLVRYSNSDKGIFSIVLPPISSSWGIADITYGQKTLESNTPECLLGKLVGDADIALAASKKSGKFKTTIHQ